jgi:predicted TIM-barrel fold metal-dependent hydrolase
MNSTSVNKWVDTHFHVFNAYEAVKGARYVPQYNADLQDWIALAQGVGVTRGVWVQPSFLGTDNSLMLRALKEHPDVLRGVAVVAVDIHADALREMHECGVRGIRLNLVGLDHDIPEWTHAEHLWQCMHDLGWHLEVHTDTGALTKVLAQLPTDMPLVVDHMAKPREANARDATVQALVQRAQQAATHIKLSGAYRLGALNAASLARLWLDELGPKSLLWGSDWPCTNHESLANYAELFAALVAWVGEQHMDDVLIHNPQRLFWDTGF